MDISIVKELEQWGLDLNGVFTLSDLKVALRENSSATLFRKVGKLIESQLLVKVKRGIYATPKTSLEVISSRIDKDAYISTGTILAKCAAIGSIPAYGVQAVKLGKPRSYSCELGRIDHLSIDPKYYFGFTDEGGILKATPEKAFIDVCYFFYKGNRFSFNPESDVATKHFNKGLLREYLCHYDKRFISYFSTHWSLS
jgi:hypothetical protein